jgi:hypothetical protein
MMQSTIARRQFLKTVGAGTLASAGLGMGVLGAPLAQAAAANVNADGAKKSRLRVGCNAYSYREVLTPGPMTLEDFIRKAVDLQLDAVDMTVYYLKSTEPEQFFDHLV